jgi:hypothetical protein
MVQLLLTSGLAAKVALLRVKALFIEESTLFWDLYSGFLLKSFDCMMRVVLSIFFFFFFRFFLLWFRHWIETNLVALENIFRGLQFCASWKVCNFNIYQAKVIVLCNLYIKEFLFRSFLLLLLLLLLLWHIVCTAIISFFFIITEAFGQLFSKQFSVQKKIENR